MLCPSRTIINCPNPLYLALPSAPFLIYIASLLPQTAYDYYASGANDEITLRENRVAYERITLLPRMLVDVSERHMGTTALGEPVSMPILVAPTAFQGLAHPEG